MVLSELILLSLSNTVLFIALLLAYWTISKRVDSLENGLYHLLRKQFPPTEKTEKSADGPVFVVPLFNKPREEG